MILNKTFYFQCCQIFHLFKFQNKSTDKITALATLQSLKKIPAEPATFSFTFFRACALISRPAQETKRGSRQVRRTDVGRRRYRFFFFLPTTTTRYCVQAGRWTLDLTSSELGFRFLEECCVSHVSVWPWDFCDSSPFWVPYFWGLEVGYANLRV